MWNKGMEMVNGKKVTWSVKAYGEPSEIYGISGGRISKLYIGVDGEDAAWYDRGWCVNPRTAEGKAVYERLLKQFN